MDDLEVEFDFEDELNADVGQPVEAPQSMPDRARKNYRQVRARERERGKERESDPPLICEVGGKTFFFNPSSSTERSI